MTVVEQISLITNHSGAPLDKICIKYTLCADFCSAMWRKPIGDKYHHVLPFTNIADTHKSITSKDVILNINNAFILKEYHIQWRYHYATALHGVGVSVLANVATWLVKPYKRKVTSIRVKGSNGQGTTRSLTSVC